MSGEVSLDRLRTFLEVYRAGSLSRAARSLGISQPTVTAQLAALERDFGTVLFERAATGVTSTARADTLAARISSHLDDLESALWSSLPQAGVERRVVQLAGPAEYLSHRVLPGLTRWCPEQMEIRTRFGLAEELLDELGRGVHDIVISSVPVHQRGLHAEPLFDEEFALVASPEAAAQWYQHGTLRAGVPVVAYADSLPILRRWWHTVWSTRPQGLNVVATVPDLRTIAAIVQAGGGVSVVPSYLIETQLLEGTLVELVEPEVRPLNTLYLVTRTGVRSTDPALAQLARALLDLETRDRD